MAKEAKKDLSEVSVEQKLTALYKLQTILSEMDKIKTLRGELPLEVRDLEDEITGLNTRIEKIKTEIEELKQNVATRKIDIETAKASIEKYKAQQDNVRNNREYDVLTKEIEFQSLEVELNEKRIKEANAAIKAKEEEIVKSQNALEERNKDLLQAFKRIRSNSRNGLGITYVQRGACGGCFNKIPAQRQLDIRMRKKIIVCEYCGRIMVDQELAGVAPVEAEVKETKPRRSRLSSNSEE